AEDGVNLAPSPATDAVLLLIENDPIEGVTQQFRLANHVAIAAVAGSRVDSGAELVRQRLERLQQRGERGSIVAVIQNDRSAIEIEKIEAGRRVFKIGDKRFQTGKDDLARNAQHPDSRSGSQRVFHLE